MVLHDPTWHSWSMGWRQSLWVIAVELLFIICFIREAMNPGSVGFTVARSSRGASWRDRAEFLFEGLQWEGKWLNPMKSSPDADRVPVRKYANYLAGSSIQAWKAQSVLWEKPVWVAWVDVMTLQNLRTCKGPFPKEPCKAPSFPNMSWFWSFYHRLKCFKFRFFDNFKQRI